MTKRCKRQRSSQEHGEPRKRQRTYSSSASSSPASMEELSVLESATVLVNMKTSSVTAEQQAHLSRCSPGVRAALSMPRMHASASSTSTSSSSQPQYQHCG